MTLFIDYEQSPNCEPRRDGKTAQYLILHYTGLPADVAHTRFMDGNPANDGYGRLSPHYMVKEDGHVVQYVHEKMRAWHAGVSYWNGERDMNSASIGIEIVNLGEPAGYPPFADAQIDATITLCRDIIRRNPGITPLHVLGHSDIAPERKLDPGPSFPWARFADAGIGMMPPGDLGPFPMDVDEIDHALTLAGYNPETAFDARMIAFCTHYAPEGLDPAGLASACAKLAWLASNKETSKSKISG